MSAIDEQTCQIKQIGNVFLLLGITSLTFSIFIRKTTIVSQKTFLILLITFLIRYRFFSQYIQDIMALQKLLIILCFAAINYMVFAQNRQSQKNYLRQFDSFYWSILLFSLIFSNILIFQWQYQMQSILVSYVHQGIAYIPQIWMIYKSKQSSNMLTIYFLMIAIWKGVYFTHAFNHFESACPIYFEVCRIKYSLHFINCLISLCGCFYSFYIKMKQTASEKIEFQFSIEGLVQNFKQEQRFYV